MFWLLTAVYSLACMADLFLTLGLMASGMGQEANPVMDQVLHLGGGWGGAVFQALGVLTLVVVLYLMIPSDRHRDREICMGIGCLLRGGVIVWNSTILCICYGVF